MCDLIVFLYSKKYSKICYNTVQCSVYSTLHGKYTAKHKQCYYRISCGRKYNNTAFRSPGYVYQHFLYIILVYLHFLLCSKYKIDIYILGSVLYTRIPLFFASGFFHQNVYDFLCCNPHEGTMFWIRAEWEQSSSFGTECRTIFCVLTHMEKQCSALGQST